MRIYKQHTRQAATDELLEILAKHPEGLRTSELSGTPKFHGGRTLSNRQIIRLLRDSARAKETVGGSGMRTYYVWQLVKADPTGKGLSGTPARD